MKSLVSKAQKVIICHIFFIQGLRLGWRHVLKFLLFLYSHTQKKALIFPFLLGSFSRKNNTVKADQKTKEKMEDDCST